MNKNFKKNLLFYGFAFIIILVCSCAEKDKKKINQPKPVSIVSIENFSKLDICGCNKQAIIILDKSTTIRKEYVDIKAFKTNSEAVKQIRHQGKRWTNLMNACFRQYGSDMWVPSDCNDVHLIDEKKKNLQELGIQIDQGEKIRL